MFISHGISYSQRPTALTLGNFDGVHLGHQAMLKRLVNHANALNIPSVVMTFEPHPKEFFLKEKAPYRLTSLREKVELLYDMGVNQVHVCRFDQHFAQITAEDFVEHYLVRQLNARWILIGDDFKFGAKRGGDYLLLQELSREYRFSVEAMHSVCQQETRISSTVVREALVHCDFERVARYLGRPYSISGRVMHGQKLGRQLGFPTANVHLQHNKLLFQGVFCVTFEVENHVYTGVANLGYRPTVTDNLLKPHLEVHLFDFNQDIYGKHARVYFLHQLRAEQKFASLEALTYQIQKDTDAARAYFAALNIIRSPSLCIEE